MANKHRSNQINCCWLVASLLALLVVVAAPTRLPGGVLEDIYPNLIPPVPTDSGSVQRAWSLDLDLDGDLDVLMTGTSGVSVAINDGGIQEGELGNLVVHPVPLSPNPGSQRIRIADLNGDGFPDFLARTSNLRVYINNGPLARVNQLFSDFFSVPGSHPQFDIGDVDRDGDLDIVSEFIDFQVTLNLGNMQGGEEGTFGTPITWDVPGSGGSSELITAFDFDGDGDSDFMSFSQFGGAIGGYSVFLNSSPDSPFFGQPIVVPDTQQNGAPLENIPFADIDTDGLLDILLYNANGIHVRRNLAGTSGHSVGEFGKAEFLLPNQAYPLQAGYFNLDATLDFMSIDGHIYCSSLTGNPDKLPLYERRTDLSSISVGLGQALTTADFDGDLRLDLLGGLFNRGLILARGIFEDADCTIPGVRNGGEHIGNSETHRISGLDVDLDSDTDLILSGGILYNLGGAQGGQKGSFSGTLAYLPSPDMINRISASDFEPDGDLDLVLSNSQMGMPDDFVWNMSVLRNMGGWQNGVPQTFDQWRNYPSYSLGTPLVADYNLDGFDDIVTLTANGLQLYRHTRITHQTTPYAFQSGIYIELTDSARWVTGGDYDSDGDFDLVLPYRKSGKIVIFWNKGGDDGGPVGEFFAEEELHQIQGADFIDNADIDGDGDFDLIISSQTENRIEILENTCHPSSENCHQFVPAGSIAFLKPIARAQPFDADGDRDSDLLVMFMGSNNNLQGAVFNKGKPQGSTSFEFSPIEYFAYAYESFAADLNGDLSPDMAFAGDSGDIVLWNSLPSLSSAETNGKRSITLHFNTDIYGPLDLPGCYNVTGAGRGNLSSSPDVVSVQNPRQVTLIWKSGEMKEGGDLIISVTDVLTDSQGRTIAFGNPTTLVGAGVGTPPVSLVSADSTQAGSPIVVSFEVTDPEGSFIESSSLFQKSEGETDFTLVGTITEGNSFNVEADSNGLYEFVVCSTDAAGNVEDENSGSPVTVLFNSTVNGSFSHTISNTGIFVFPMEDELDIHLNAQAITAPATISIFRTKGDVSPTAPRFAGFLVDESLSVQGNLMAITGSLQWELDPISDDSLSEDFDQVIVYSGGLFISALPVQPGVSPAAIDLPFVSGDYYLGNSLPSTDTGWMLME